MDQEGEQPTQDQQPTPQQPTPTLASTSPLKQIRTFEGDVAEAIKREDASVVSIAQSAQARRDAVRMLGPKEVERVQGRGRLVVYSLLTILLLALGGYGAKYAYSTYTKKVAAPTIATPENQLIPADSVTTIDASTLSRQTLLAALDAERVKTRSTTAIEQVELRHGSLATSDILPTADFFTRIGSHAPDNLVRSLDPTFMLGLLGAPSHTFMLINIASFEGAFPGMLSYEPRLAEDLLPFFASEAVAANVPTETAWSDVTINNRDARILKDPTGHTVLLYAFFDNKVLVLADNEDTFRTIVNQLQSEKLSR